MRVDCARCDHASDETYEFDMPIAEAQPLEELAPRKCPDCHGREGHQACGAGDTAGAHVHRALQNGLWGRWCRDCALSHAPPLRSPYAALQPSKALPGPAHTLVPVGRQFKKSQSPLGQTAWREQSIQEDDDG